ncbi:OmpH family outer membrane protein [Paracoccus aestuarii]|uniref:OmpH family outer membrane protein n=1 Tax=Paracoccus aestuarii TaxID=453842 RepID=A0A419A1Z8_9RHOB|nr:OmpH family outer membrane protein [Paracoccus aestuarii]RJL06958.1 OmpH family outer membrane protein [Paracoccus aestuarii]WCR00474.1 OmpH family outer membrane protein [Paracoccus aestuarii]
MRGAGVVLLALLLAAPAAAQVDPGADPGPAEPAEIPPPRIAPMPADIPAGTIPAPADQVQTVPILTVDQDMLYLNSAWGLRAQSRLEAEGDLIAEENERLTQMLSAEEARLTEVRPTLSANEFRRMAENFDIRATEIRRERAQAVQELNAWAEADRAAFFRAALPVMGQVMDDRGAVAVLDRRTVFVSLDAIDVTDRLIEAVDQRVGDGDGAVPLPDGAGSAQGGDPVADQGE